MCIQTSFTPSAHLRTVTAKLTYFIHIHQRGLKFEKRVTSNTFFRRWFVNRTSKYGLKHKLQRLVKWIGIIFLITSHSLPSKRQKYKIVFSSILLPWLPPSAVTIHSSQWAAWQQALASPLCIPMLLMDQTSTVAAFNLSMGLGICWSLPCFLFSINRKMNYLKPTKRTLMKLFWTTGLLKS